MTRFEESIWCCCVGVLIGMMIAYWFMFDTDFYEKQWPIMAGVIMAWFVGRELIYRRWKHDKS